MITQSQLKELLSYNQETGVFTWKIRSEKWFAHCKFPHLACKIWNARYSNTVAGHIHSRGCASMYISIRLCVIKSKQKAFQGHRLAWLYMTGNFPKEDIDHIDHNGLNNSWDNLRCVSNFLNLQNIPMSKRNKSGFTGVNWDKNREKWTVYIHANGKNINGGGFENIDDAIAKRIELNKIYGFHENHGLTKVI